MEGESCFAFMASVLLFCLSLSNFEVQMFVYLKGWGSVEFRHVKVDGVPGFP